MKFIPHNQHTRDAYRCEELALELYSLGREVEAEFWWRVRDEKFDDAIKYDSRAEAQHMARDISRLRSRNEHHSVLADTDRDTGIDNGSTTSNGALNRNNRK